MRSFCLFAAAACLSVSLGCEATLESGLRETEANEIVVALHAAQIGARKEADDGRGDEPTYRVVVPHGDVDDALDRMRSEGLPRRAQAGFESVFGEGGLVPTATEERARYVSALGGELATSIEAIDGVLEARVHVALPDARRLALDEDPPRPRASVLIRHRGERAPYDEASLRALIAGAVPQMLPEDVALIAVPAVAADSRAERLVSIGPVSVTRGSATALKAILGSALALHVLLAGLLAFVLLRRRRPPEPPLEERAA